MEEILHVCNLIGFGGVVDFIIPILESYIEEKDYIKKKMIERLPEITSYLIKEDKTRAETLFYS